MRRLKKIILWAFGIGLSIYVFVCILMYFNQEKILFHPKKLEATYNFEYKNKFEELTINTEDNKKLNGLIFKADSSKGLIFYLHGNAGALDTWGSCSKYYNSLGYDLFILDYRGFGKSEGEIFSEEQFFEDIQAAYNEMKKRYAENKIVIAGYSIGTGPAAMLASKNNPKLLVLQAPYYSIIDMMSQSYPFVPSFLLKYKFETCEYVKNTKAPIYIFHGNADKIIYYGSSIKLKEHLKTGDKLFTLEGEGHSGMNDNKVYQAEIEKVLN